MFNFNLWKRFETVRIKLILSQYSGYSPNSKSKRNFVCLLNKEWMKLENNTILYIWIKTYLLPALVNFLLLIVCRLVVSIVLKRSSQQAVLKHSNCFQICLNISDFQTQIQDCWIYHQPSTLETNFMKRINIVSNSNRSSRILI